MHYLFAFKIDGEPVAEHCEIKALSLVEAIKDCRSVNSIKAVRTAVIPGSAVVVIILMVINVSVFHESNVAHEVVAIVAPSSVGKRRVRNRKTERVGAGCSCQNRQGEDTKYKEPFHIKVYFCFNFANLIK